jgi:hypothetical protein
LALVGDGPHRAVLEQHFAVRTRAAREAEAAAAAVR